MTWNFVNHHPLIFSEEGPAVSYSSVNLNNNNNTNNSSISSSTTSSNNGKNKIFDYLIIDDLELRESSSFGFSKEGPAMSYSSCKLK